MHNAGSGIKSASLTSLEDPSKHNLTKQIVKVYNYTFFLEKPVDMESFPPL